jgi:hypothetical protein
MNRAIKERGGPIILPTDPDARRRFQRLLVMFSHVVDQKRGSVTVGRSSGDGGYGKTPFIAGQHPFAVSGRRENGTKYIPGEKKL